MGTVIRKGRGNPPERDAPSTGGAVVAVGYLSEFVLPGQSGMFDPKRHPLLETHHACEIATSLSGEGRRWPPCRVPMPGQAVGLPTAETSLPLIVTAVAHLSCFFRELDQ